MERLILLDTSAIMFRAFYANMHFRTKTEPTGAVYGFTNTLLSIINEFNPTYIGAAFDVKRDSLKRREIYKEYKAHRDAVPEDLLSQIPRIEELLDCFNIKKCKVDGYEADDILGTIASHAANQDTEVIVITGDKDLAQILDKNIKIALLGKGEGGDKFKIIETEADVMEYLGVTSNMIPDLFGLIGDTSDGIPGIRKIGPKKAIPMLERFSNIEGIYENIEHLTEIPGIGKSLIDNIREDKELAFLSRTLAIIDKNVPLNCDIASFSYNIEKEKLYNLFKTLEFRGLIKKLELEGTDEFDSGANSFHNTKAEYNEINDKNNIENLKNDSDTNVLEYRERSINFVLIDSEEKFLVMEKSLKSSEIISVFCLNTGISISNNKFDFYIPLWHKSLFLENFDIEKTKDLFKNVEVKITTFNGKLLLNQGIQLNNLYLDVMIGYHLLTSQSKENIDIPISKIKECDLESYQTKFGKEDPQKLIPSDYGLFLAERSKGILDITEYIIKELKNNDLYDVLTNIEHPLIEVLSAMEVKGIEINPHYFANYSIELEKSILENQNKIYELAMGEFNLNSPKQLAEVLFMKLNIPSIKKTKTGLSTDVDVLEELQSQGVEIAKFLLEYRKLAKLKSTYVDTLPLLVDSENRIHTTFNQIGTTTGRLSSLNPNLQNIPVRSDEGIKIREGFVAKKGYQFLGVDYSQIELRVLGELSEDLNLISAYQNNEDLHALTARRLFLDGDDTKEITRDQRAVAKTINFSIIYGKTPFGLSKELGITPREAGEYINKYFQSYPYVKEFEKSIISFSEKHGYTETYFKRRRIIEGINSQNKNIKNQAERMAVNSVIQGTAAEIIKKAMIGIYERIKDKDDISLLLQVHDELIFEIKEGKEEEYKIMIEDIMRNCVTFKNIKLDVNTNIGKNWAKIK